LGRGAGGVFKSRSKSLSRRWSLSLPWSLMRGEDSMIKAIDTLVGLAKDGFRSMESATVEHFSSVGRFLLAVGSMDAQLNSLLQSLVNAEYAACRALVGEMRIGDIIQAIRRIALAKNTDKSVISTMDSLFSEINVLRSARDDIAHKIMMVDDTRMAFHNASVAKDDYSIEVAIYSIDEFIEFSKYAVRLNHRILLLRNSLITERESVLYRSYLTTVGLTILLQTATAIIKKPDIGLDKIKAIKLAAAAASPALDAYNAVASSADKSTSKLELEAVKAIHELFIQITQATSSEDLSSLDIPLRLRKPDRRRKEKGAQPLLPPPSSSQG
jgi:hypothetical protein